MLKTGLRVSKAHLVSIAFQLSDEGGWKVFVGLVTGSLTESGKLIVSPDKIYEKAFGAKLPAGSKIHVG